MATNKELLAQYLLIEQVLEREDYDALKKIVRKMIRELSTTSDE